MKRLRAEHSEIDQLIRSTDGPELLRVKEAIEGELIATTLNMNSKPSSGWAQEDIAWMIDLLARIEAHNLGKGWLYRARRRAQLMKQVSQHRKKSEPIERGRRRCEDA